MASTCLQASAIAVEIPSLFLIFSTSSTWFYFFFSYRMFLVVVLGGVAMYSPGTPRLILTTIHIVIALSSFTTSFSNSCSVVPVVCLSRGGSRGLIGFSCWAGVPFNPHPIPKCINPVQSSESFHTLLFLAVGGGTLFYCTSLYKYAHPVQLSIDIILTSIV